MEEINVDRNIPNGFQIFAADFSFIENTKGNKQLLFLYVSNLISKLLISPMKDTQIASELEVSLPQTKAWLNRLVAEDKIIKTNKGGSYTNAPQSIPFGHGLADPKLSVR